MPFRLPSPVFTLTRTHGNGAATLVSYHRVRRTIDIRNGFRTFLSSALFLASALRSPAAEHIQLPTGDLRAAVLTDLKPHPSGSKTYNEFWTYHFLLDGNIQVILNFSRVNLGSFKSPVCGADLTIMGFQGRNWSVAREYDKKNFVFTDSAQGLRVHENIWFSGRLPESHHAHFATTKKNVSYYLDLDFTDIQPGRVWGDGMFKFGGGDALGIFIHIPSAKVKGRLGINQDTSEVSGRAYMDHTFQTDLAPNLVSAGYRYVSETDPAEAGYFLDPASRFEKRPVGYGLKSLNGELVLRRPETLKVLSASKAMGAKVATAVEIGFQDGSKTVLNRGEDRMQQSVLHEFSGFTKMAIKSFMGGEILTFRGVGTIAGARPMAYNFFTVE
jgi:hypothetical protein